MLTGARPRCARTFLNSNLAFVPSFKPEINQSAKVVSENSLRSAVFVFSEHLEQSEGTIRFALIHLNDALCHRNVTAVHKGI